MPAVLDPNVLIAALLSREGTPAKVFQAWLDGAFELVISPRLLEELARALAYPKLKQRIAREDASELIELLRRGTPMADDPPAESTSSVFSSRDPGDDYLLALAVDSPAALVSGDADLLALQADLPIFTPAAFLELISGPVLPNQ